MLSKEHLRVQVRGRELVPRWVDPTAAAPLRRAGALLDLLREAVEGRWTRGQVEEEITDLVGDGRDHRLVRGLAKLLVDKTVFGVSSPVTPRELRAEVFRRAREVGPLALERSLLDRPVAEEVLAEVGAAHGLTAGQVAEALYADLRTAQRVESAQLPSSPEALLQRYNVALVQGLLLRALEVRVHLTAPSPPRLRQLFRYVKFHQLMHDVRRVGSEVQVVLDGPTSVLTQSTRYGKQLATFFPAVLLQDPPWSVEATVLWTKAQHRKRLALTDALGLVSHYRDTGAWVAQEATWFQERFTALGSEWDLSDAVEPVDLGGRALVMPDFRLEREGRVAWLEIVGFWRRDYLERRLELLERYGPGNLILALSTKLVTEEVGELPGEVVPFARVVPARDVLAAAERVAR